MLLRNYYNQIAALTLGISSTDTNTFGDGHINLKKSNMAVVACDQTATYAAGLGLGLVVNTSLTTPSTSQSTMIFGTGTTVVTFDDYVLDSQITSGLTKASFFHGTPAYNSTTKKWTNTLSCVLSNSTAGSMTITEVGILSTLNNTYVLVYREVLASPITLAPGDNVTYVQNLEYTMP